MTQKQNIISIFESFYKITKARLSLYDAEFNELLSFPKELLPFCSAISKNPLARRKCSECDRRAFEIVKKTGKEYTYTCHCGLIETVTPIYHFGVLSGYIMMVQITDKEYKSKQNIREQSKIYFDGNEHLSAAVLRIPEISHDLISAYIDILKVISEFVTQSNFLSTRTEDRPLNIKNYINIHFCDDISIDSIAFELDCSRATVMNSFKKAYGITVNDYITQKRLLLACELLKGGSDSIKKVASDCGFHDQNYFSRVFLSQHKITPTQYRQKYKK